MAGRLVVFLNTLSDQKKIQRNNLTKFLFSAWHVSLVFNEAIFIGLAGVSVCVCQGRGGGLKPVFLDSNPRPLDCYDLKHLGSYLVRIIAS